MIIEGTPVRPRNHRALSVHLVYLAILLALAMAALSACDGLGATVYARDVTVVLCDPEEM